MHTDTKLTAKRRLLRFGTMVVALTLVLFGAAGAQAQAVCEDCQPLITQLQTLHEQLAKAQAAFTSLQDFLADLESTQTAPGLAFIKQRTPQLEALRGEILRLTKAVQEAESQLQQCQRGCKKKRQPPKTDPAGTNFVDESLPRARCPECQPLVDRILDLQRQRRFARNRLNSIDDRLETWAGRDGPAGSGAVGLLLLQDRKAAVDSIGDLTAQIAQVLGELTACNEKCVQAPGGGTTLVTPQAGGTVTPNVTPPVTCKICEEAARRLADAEARKKLIEDELKEHERLRQQQEQQQAEQQESRQKRLGELRANGQGNGDEAFQLQIDIRAHEHEQAVRKQAAADDQYPAELNKRLSTAEEEVSDLRKQFEECQKECKPKKTSQLFRGPLPYAIGTGVLVAVLTTTVGGSSTTTTSSVTQTQQTQPQLPVRIAVRIDGGTGNHPQNSNTSLVCAILTTDPPAPGATWVLVLAGPAVVPNQAISGVLDAQGRAAIRGSIANTGTYTMTVTVTVNGVSFTGTTSVTVTGASNPCPSV